MNTDYFAQFSRDNKDIGEIEYSIHSSKWAKEGGDWSRMNFIQWKLAQIPSKEWTIAEFTRNLVKIQMDFAFA